MAGKSIEEARLAQATQRAAKKAARAAAQGQSANIATTGTPTSSPTATTTQLPAAPSSNELTPMVIAGVTYYPGLPVSTAPPTAQIAMAPVVQDWVDPSTGQYTQAGQYFSYLALGEPPRASVDWVPYSSTPDPASV
jgi:hypothetical protein